MKLKDAFRYKSVIGEWIQEMLTFDHASQYKTTELHLKQSVVPSEKDETIDVSTSSRTGFNTVQAFDFIRLLLQEYAAVSQAIDASMAMNAAGYKSTLDTARQMRLIGQTFRQLASLEETESRSMGTGAYISAAGASQYLYPIVTKKTPILDPKVAAEAAKKLMDQADERSVEIDRILLDVEVNFEPAFSVNDSCYTAAISAGIFD